VQANALLSEELSDPGQQQLSRLVQQNAQRLEKTVHDILHVVQVPNTEQLVQAQQLDLTLTLPRICRDWQSHRGAKPDIAVSIPNTQAWVWFDPEHLRRILINLLDNAQRYISPRPDAIQISLDKSWGAGASTSICLRVWSDGAPLDPSVEQHLFEPFFSSESRSSGLGLYICRELCNSHGADINYQRSSRPLGGQMLSGNEFFVTFKTLPAHDVHVCSVQPNE
jgi:two-component system sensor histidine kinase PilS (NtrC family)